MPMPGRTIIISDTHLGRSRGSAGTPEQLRPLWAGANRLIVNGDLAELGDPHARARAARMVCRLQDLCDADGVELLVISGNHDPLLTDVRDMDLCDGSIYLTHGDVLHPAISPWTTHAAELEHWNRRALAMLSKQAKAGAKSDAESRLAAAQHAAHAVAISHADDADERARTRRADAPDERSPSRRQRLTRQARTAAVAMWSWHTLPRRAAEFMIEFRPQARFFVFGHMHRQGIWRFGERVVINTGSYGLPGKPRAVVLKGDRLAVHAIQRTNDGHSLSARAIAEFPIRPLPARQPRNAASPAITDPNAAAPPTRRAA
ncbi:MAG: metallophosphoesterase family protein [Phycisphaerales bacterium]